MTLDDFCEGLKEPVIARAGVEGQTDFEDAPHSKGNEEYCPDVYHFDKRSVDDLKKDDIRGWYYMHHWVHAKREEYHERAKNEGMKEFEEELEVDGRPDLKCLSCHGC